MFIPIKIQPWTQQIWQSISRPNPPWNCLLISPSFSSLTIKDISGNRTERCLEREESSTPQPQIRAKQGSSDRGAGAVGRGRTDDSSKCVTAWTASEHACEERWKMVELAKPRNKNKPCLPSHKTTEARLENSTFNSKVRVNSNIEVSAF